MAVSRVLNRIAALGCVAALVAACSPSNTRQPVVEVAPTAPAPARAAAAASTIGTGPTKVALILPLTQNGVPSAVGPSLRNAAELAYAESGSNALTILVKDDRGTPDGARDATQTALNEGADLVLGPVFAGGVREAGRVAHSAGKPLIGFSTDTSSASSGVYLLSFLIEGYVDRIVDYASQQGKKSFGALVPENDYGNVALAEFQAAVSRRGGQVAALERYQPGQATAAVQRIAEALPRIDALFIPEQADALPGVATALAASGVDSHKVQILGTGSWNDARVLRLPALQGAWFAAPETAGFNAFASRYRAKFGAEPARIATLSYDAVSLAAALARGGGGFSDSTLTNASGFNGADGVFRFRAEGPNERGLAVLQVSNGAAVTVSPAPRSFTAPVTQ